MVGRYVLVPINDLTIPRSRCSPAKVVEPHADSIAIEAVWFQKGIIEVGFSIRYGIAKG